MVIYFRNVCRMLSNGTINIYNNMHREKRMRFASYITGSRAYGHRYQTNYSDIDLVVAVDCETLSALHRAAYADHQSYKLQFGNLNLVAFNLDFVEEQERYYKWRQAHDYLMGNPPKTKEEAIAVFRGNCAEKTVGEY